ncbi:methyltransferase [Planctomycetota bacterium]
MSIIWNAQTLLETMRQFQPACILGTGAELDVFTALQDRSTDAVTLAQALDCDPRGLTILLDSLVALGLLTKTNDHYTVPSDLAPLLCAGSPQNILPGIRHLANCQRRWAQLATVVKNGGPADITPSVRGSAGDLESFIRAMENYTLPFIQTVVHHCRGISFKHLLDIGGAGGHWTRGFLKAVPTARATLFDLPDVIPMARQRLAEAGMLNCVTLVAGDYNTDALPSGVDLAWLSAITHQNSRSQNRTLYQRIFTALSDGGTLLIRDNVLETDRTCPVAGALFAVNMLVATEGGNSYSFAEYREDLKQAGFSDVALLHADEGMNALIRATR